MFVIVINPFRWKWALFVLMGVGAVLPQEIVRHEDKIRQRTRNGTSEFKGS